MVDMIEPIPPVDGVVRYSSTSKYLLHDRRGNTVGLYGVGRDVTEYRSAFEQLKLLTDNIPGGLATFRISQEQVSAQYLSESVYELVGYPKDAESDASALNVLTIIFDEDMPIVKEQIEKLWQYDIPIDIEFRVHTLDGGYKWLNLRCSLAQRQEDAVIINAVIFDVSEKKIADEANRIHEEEMKAAMSQMGKMICEYDPVTLELTMPEVYANWYGVPSVLKNIPYVVREFGILEEKNIPLYIEFYEAIQRGEKKGAHDIHIRRKDHSWHWEHHEFVTIFGDDGKPIKAVLSVEDTTALLETKQQYEHELQLRHELVKDSVIYYELNLSTGMIEEYLSQLSDVTSMKSSVCISERIHTDIMENIFEEDQELVKNSIFSNALLRSYGKGKMSTVIEYRRFFPDKSVHWVRANATIMKKPYSDELLAFIYIRDIDVEKKEQQALDYIMEEEIEAVCMLHILVQKLHYVKTRDESYAVGQMLDYKEHIQNFIQTKVTEEDRESATAFFDMRNLMEVLNKEAFAIYTYRTTKTEGFVFRKRILVFYLNDAHEEIVFSNRDITRLYEEEQHQKAALREAVEVANKANHAKSIFLSRMSHDMRTPLNAILTMSGQEMLEGATAEQKDQYLEKIHTSGEYLLGIINDVLDMSRIESGKTVLEPAPYYVPGFKTMIETVIGETCRKKGIQFNYIIKGHKSDWVMLDKVRFEQIFINLLSNAVKFTHSGGTIDFMIDTLGYDGVHIDKRFIISDTGVGMSEEFLPHAFESFAQESRRDISENSQGTGLGLAIVKKTVDLMGGKISIDSKIGKGTTFTVDLSYETVDNPSELSSDEISLDKLSGRRILLCEDNEINTEIIVTLLERKGMTVTCAENGQIGLQKFEDEPIGSFDLILMDKRMPVMDGIEATKAIRALKREDVKTIPIIALTADAFVEDEQLSISVGMNGHLPKPIVPKYLYEMIASYM